MKQRIDNKLRELKKIYERRLANANSPEIDPYARPFWLAKANETLAQIELLKEIRGD